MKIKKRKIVILSFIFIIIALLVIAVSTNIINIQQINENVRKSLYGEPIDLSTGIINNEYFNISSNGTNAKNTTDGLNKAIEYASENNIKNIKLEQGTYLVNGVGERSKEKGIILKSNINLDLNNSEIIHETNSSIRYSIFTLYNVENVIITNGIIIGDKNTHDYNTVESTHEWGFGIEIKGCTNIKFCNLQIEQMTGDGIIISDYTAEGRKNISQGIEIFNNTIFNCRRQGISVICAKNIEIHDNEIYSINGTEPRSTIDLEPDNETQLVENVKIYNNKLYNENNCKAIQIIKYVKNTEIFGNEINGILSIRAEQNEIKISDNIISNGVISFRISKDEINNNWIINKIQLTNNKINNCTIKLINIKDALLMNNTLNNSQIEIQSSNIAIADNVFDNSDEKNYLYKYEIENGDNNNYNLYLWKNKVEEDKENIINSESLTVYRDYESIKQYIKDKFNEILQK